MDEFRIERKVEGISEVRDETDRTGLRIVIELKRSGCTRHFKFLIQKHGFADSLQL